MGGDGDHEYTLPKNLLCSQSPYFEKLLKEVKYKDGKEETLVLEPIAHIDTLQSFQMLIQWLH
jgi:hypothetical protein